MGGDIRRIKASIMTYIRVVNGSPEPFSPSPRQLYNAVKKQCWPWPVPDSVLADYDIFKVAETTPPTPGLDEVVTEAAPVEIGGVWTQQWEIVPKPVRSSLQPNQWKRALEARGRWGAFKTYFAGLSQSDQLEWLYADRIERSGPLITELQAATGLTNAQINEIFRA